ncbi:hypothetical protein BGX31_011012 [Mortierella sp. GBA43]|nr:hypothetical protein BGX31_011012 [Mortierella sp. GBA43]
MSNSTGTAADIANGHPEPGSNPILVLEPVNNTFAIKSLELPENTRIKIGRQTGVSTAPNPTNGYFDSKVLSRIHAEVWSENGKVFIRDLKSSNGTFLNGKRLCPENVESEPFALNQNDHLEFGIDIMDDNGALLHEKVACKIFISRMPYPSPGGSPKETHAKPRSSSPPGSGSSSKSTAGVSGGQGSNIDLLMARLQSELTRAQDTQSDLGVLKQGLGELERAITASSNEDMSNSAKRADAQVDYQKLLEENVQAHTLEITKLNKQLEEAQSEVEAYIQKIQILEPLVAEDEILRRDIAQSSAELTQVRLERDLAKDSMNELITEHQQSMDILRKEHEAAMTAMEAMHKENLERAVREAALAQDILTSKYQEDLAKAVQSATGPQVEIISVQEHETLRLEVSSLKKEVSAFQETIETQVKDIQARDAEKASLAQQLALAKAETVRTEKELQLAKQRIEQEELSTLTPTSPTNTAAVSICQQCRGQVTTSSLTSTGKDSKDVVTKHEFSWLQLMSNNDPSRQSPAMAISGGVIFVGIGAFYLWRKGLSR